MLDGVLVFFFVVVNNAILDNFILNNSLRLSSPFGNFSTSDPIRPHPPAFGLSSPFGNFSIMFTEPKSLMKNGYFVIKADPERVAHGRSLYNDYLKHIPELRSDYDIGTDDIGAGSFGALNFSSAYHNPAKIYLDQLIVETVEPLIRGVAAILGLENFQFVPDRSYYRCRKQNPESYHSDNTNGAEKTDVFFGAKLNLNEDIDQALTLVPGTQKQSASVKGGEFCVVKDKADVAFYKAREEVITFGPNEIVIFYENIIHRISGKKPKKPILRNGIGIRITDSEVGWMADKNDLLFAEQGAVAHKGGEIAPMYPRLWLTNWSQKLEAYTDRLIPPMKTTHKFKTGKRAGETIVLPFKTPPSLTVLGKRYRSRTEEETKIFKIRSIWDD